MTRMIRRLDATFRRFKFGPSLTIAVGWLLGFYAGRDLRHRTLELAMSLFVVLMWIRADLLIAQDADRAEQVIALKGQG
jgi:hypothetical protein